MVSEEESYQVLGAVESQAGRGHIELGRAKTRVRTLSAVKGGNPLDLTSLLRFVDSVLVSEVALELPVSFATLSCVRAPSIPIRTM